MNNILQTNLINTAASETSDLQHSIDNDRESVVANSELIATNTANTQFAQDELDSMEQSIYVLESLVPRLQSQYNNLSDTYNDYLHSALGLQSRLGDLETNGDTLRDQIVDSLAAVDVIKRTTIPGLQQKDAELRSQIEGVGNSTIYTGNLLNIVSQL